MSNKEFDIAAAVTERVAEEAKGEEKQPEKKTGEVSSKFVLECLDAEALGDGMLYAEIHKERFVYAKNSGQWYVWDEHTWRRDDLDEAISAVETVAMRYAEEIAIREEEITKAKKTHDDDYISLITKRERAKITRLKKRISSLRKRDGRNNCILFAHTNPVNQISITGSEFDLEPYLLGTPNGVINLKTGELEPGRQSDYITKRTSVPYLGLNLPTGLIDGTMKSIYDGDMEKIYFLQRLLGSALIGKVIDHVFPVFIGRGRNGKSLIIERLRHVMGDYAGVVPAELMLDSTKQGSHNQSDPVMKSLKGLRLAVASETGEGRKFSSERVKWMTGGDTLSARGLYDKYPESWTPTHMLILITNHEPGAPAGDMAFWERCILIRHLLSFVSREPEKDFERKADPELPDKLAGAGSEFLTFLVIGCMEYQKQGLNPPESVRSSTMEYREDEDFIGQFLEACTNSKQGSKATATELHVAFSIWYRKNVNPNPRFTPSQKAFGSKLKAREEFPKSKSAGITYYNGIELTPEYLDMVLKEASKGDGGDYQ